MNWDGFAAAAPELAAVARSELERSGLMLVGTLRTGGAPRISCVLPSILDGELYLGMMWRSRKAVDLLRDPRLVLHNAVSTNRGDEVEIALHGRATEVEDEDVRRRYLDTAPEWTGRRFHLFCVGIESAGLVRYERGEQYVKVWPRGRELRRAY